MSDERRAALAYRGSELVGLQLDPRGLKSDIREWEEKGYRVVLTTYDDASETWWTWRLLTEGRDARIAGDDS